MLYLLAALFLAAVVVRRIWVHGVVFSFPNAIMAAIAGDLVIKGLHAVGTIPLVPTRTAGDMTILVSMALSFEMVRRWAADGRPVAAWPSILLWSMVLACLVSEISIAMIGADNLIGAVGNGEHPLYDSDGLMAYRYLTVGIILVIGESVLLFYWIRTAWQTQGHIREAFVLLAIHVTLMIAAGLLWAAQGIVDPGSAEAPLTELGVAFSQFSLLFLCAAFWRGVVMMSKPYLSRQRRRALKGLKPLWERLHPLDPSVALFPGYDHRERGMALEMSVLRVIHEIRQWTDEIAAGVPKGTYAAATTGATSEVRHKRRDAVAAAAWIIAGMRSEDRQLPAEASDIAALPVGSDPDEELQMLLRIAREIDRDPAKRLADTLPAVHQRTVTAPVVMPLP